MDKDPESLTSAYNWDDDFLQKSSCLNQSKRFFIRNIIKLLNFLNFLSFLAKNFPLSMLSMHKSKGFSQNSF